MASYVHVKIQMLQ